MCFTFLVLIFFSTMAQCEAYVTSMSRGVYHPNHTIIFDERTFYNPRLLYALCDTSIKCKLEYDREPFERPTDTCQVNLETGIVINKIRVVPFNKNTAILVWMEKTDGDTYFNLLGVRFNDCSTHKVRSSFDYNSNVDFTFQPNLAAYEHSYIVIFINSKLCGNKYCKMTVDFETNQIQGPIPWIPVDQNLLIADIIALGSTEENLLLIQFSGQVSMISDNDWKILKQSELQSNVLSATLSYSISNKLIGICELTNNSLKLSQFNHSGVLIFYSVFPIDSTFIPRAMYNLPDGGMLVLLNKQTTDIHRILKFDDNGTQVSHLDVRIRCIYIYAAQFFEKANRYCASLACFDNDNYNKSHLEVVARCFNLSDIRAI